MRNFRSHTHFGIQPVLFSGSEYVNGKNNKNMVLVSVIFEVALNHARVSGTAAIRIVVSNSRKTVGKCPYKCKRQLN